MKKFRSRRGLINLTEIVIVVAILAMFLLLVQPAYRKNIERTRLKLGIHQLYNIKKTMEQYADACRGYPWVPAKTFLINVIDCCSDTYGTGNNPRIYDPRPDVNKKCDTTTFQEMLPGIIYDDNNPTKFDACDYTDTECVKSSNAFGGVNKSFAKAPPGNPVSALCASPFGWSFSLVENVPAILEPTAVYCGAVGLFNGYAIVLIDSEGGGRQLPEGPMGAYVTNDCACGAWCYESLTGTQGCCNNCDGAGNFKMPVRY